MIPNSPIGHMQTEARAGMQSGDVGKMLSRRRGGDVAAALVLAGFTLLSQIGPVAAAVTKRVGNPIITNLFTADPAAMVYKDTVYLYTGHDEAKGREMFTMWDWLCFTSKDMKTWAPHGSIMRVTDFKWAARDAWASQAIAISQWPFMALACRVKNQKTKCNAYERTDRVQYQNHEFLDQPRHVGSPMQAV